MNAMYTFNQVQLQAVGGKVLDVQYKAADEELRFWILFHAKNHPAYRKQER